MRSIRIVLGGLLFLSSVSQASDIVCTQPREKGSQFITLRAKTPSSEGLQDLRLSFDMDGAGEPPFFVVQAASVSVFQASDLAGRSTSQSFSPSSMTHILSALGITNGDYRLFELAFYKDYEGFSGTFKTQVRRIRGDDEFDGSVGVLPADFAQARSFRIYLGVFSETDSWPEFLDCSRQ